MQARTLTIVTILVDLKNTFLTLLRENRKNPALLVMYTFIDICAALVNDGKTRNREIFETCINTHVQLLGKPFSAYDLWAARSSLLHSYSPLGHHMDKENAARPIFYYAWPDRKKDIETVLRDKGYKDFILLNVEDVKWVAIDVINSILQQLRDDPIFEVRFLKNSEHFLFDLQAFKLEAELSMLQELARPGADA